MVVRGSRPRLALLVEIESVQDRPDESLADLERYYGEQQRAELYPAQAQPRSSTPPGTGASGS
jgi:hypothetical protein